MFTLLLLSSLLAASASGAAAADNATAAGACVTGDAVHMIIARASLEAPGPGIIGNVGTMVMAQLPGSDMESVVYPATLANYTTSEAMGVSAMTALVTGYAARCPASKMVLMGYSQGAQVTMDVLCGTQETNFAATAALPADISSKVVAAVMMGDPSKAMNETFLAGTSTKDAVFPRKSTADCAAMTSRMVSFCNSNDTFCDSGSSIQVHLSYVQDNGTAALDFVVGKAKAGAAPAVAARSMSMSASAAGRVGAEAFSMVLGLLGVGLGFALVA